MFKTLKKATLRGKNNGQMAISRFQHTIKHTWFELFWQNSKFYWTGPHIFFFHVSCDF